VGYTPRTYRRLSRPQGLVPYRVQVGESDLAIWSTQEWEQEAIRLLCQARGEIEEYIARSREFEGALSPLPPDPSASLLIQQMLEAGHRAGVGPMAAVAGAIAAFVGAGLPCPEVMIENGGDLYLRITRPRTIALFAGENSPFSYKLGLKINPLDSPLGVSTSSGTLGHALSFGRADAVTILSPNCALSDAAATAVANKVQGPDSIDRALAFAQKISEVTGVVIACQGKLGVWGKVELVNL